MTFPLPIFCPILTKLGLNNKIGKERRRGTFEIQKDNVEESADHHFYTEAAFSSTADKLSYIRRGKRKI